MKIQQFLDHYEIEQNPFADEDAQTDRVFKDYCFDTTYHPSWDKIYGNPQDPSTAIVFGEKGSGKTALRIQIARHLSEYNAQNTDEQIFVIEYDDFNPFLDHFQDQRFRSKSPERTLSSWKVWDHMDAILSLGITQLVDLILHEKYQGESDHQSRYGAIDIKKLDRLNSRDLLLLAACYDRSTAETYTGRWNKLRKALKFSSWKSKWDFALGLLVIFVLALVIISAGMYEAILKPWTGAIVLAGWIPWIGRTWKRFWIGRGIKKHIRVYSRDTKSLIKLLRHFSDDEIVGQPFPRRQRSDDRYELMAKFQDVLKKLGFAGITVIVDRVDEPDLVGWQSGTDEIIDVAPA